MSCSRGNKYLQWEGWGTAVLVVYCIATLFMVFLSITAVQMWPSPWNRLSILSACLIPQLLVLAWKVPRLIRDKELVKHSLFVPIIIILGILNIVFSEDQSTTLTVMVLFLISGIGIFAATSYLLTTQFRQNIFLWLCWALLLALCIYGAFEYITKKPILLFSLNPIPAGSLLILLFIGPFLLFSSSSWWLRILQLTTIVFSVALIVMIGKRGPISGLLGIAFLLPILLPWKKLWIIPLIALVLVGTGYKMRSYLPPTFSKHLITHKSTLLRLENYPFAAHIFLQKPLFGIGLHAPLTEYLQDYRQKITKKGRYPGYIQKKKTLENIILCGFVEMGGLFTITYIALIIYLLRNLFHGIRGKPEKRVKTFLLLIPLAGFFIHSMTYDSLIYPHLNWLFHSYLGLIANFDKI